MPSPRRIDHGRVDGFELFEYAVDYLAVAFEQFIRAAGVEVAEGGLVQRTGLHDAACGELRNYG